MPKLSASIASYAKEIRNTYLHATEEIKLAIYKILTFYTVTNRLYQMPLLLFYTNISKSLVEVDP